MYLSQNHLNGDEGNFIFRGFSHLLCMFFVLQCNVWQVSNRPTRVAFLVWTLAVKLVLCGTGVSASNNTKNCQLYSESASERKVLSRLEPLTKKK